jgi:hypothetical protein
LDINTSTSGGSLRIFFITENNSFGTFITNREMPTASRLTVHIIAAEAEMSSSRSERR